MNVFRKQTTADERAAKRYRIVGLCTGALFFVGIIAVASLPPNPRPFLKVVCAQKLSPETSLNMENEITAGEANLVLSNAPSYCKVQRCETGSEKITTCKTATEKDIATIESDVEKYEKTREKHWDIAHVGLLSALVIAAIFSTIIRWKHKREKKREDEEFERRVTVENAKARDAWAQVVGQKKPTGR